MSSLARGEEEAQPALGQLLGIEVIAHPDHVGEVVGADLDGRLADLERGLGRRALALLGDHDRRLRAVRPSAADRASARQAATEDRNVEVALLSLT
jgi:hypothetical protein